MIRKWLKTPSTWFRYILIIAISVVITIIVVDYRIVSAERTGCERRQPIFTTLNGILKDAQKQAGDKTVKINGKKVLIRDYYQQRIDVITPLIVKDCDAVYPNIISLPFEVD